MNILVPKREEFVVRPERIGRALRQAEAEAGSRPAKGELRGGDGFLQYRFPRALVVNAVAGHGESLDDEGYWADMARRHPECRVKYEGKTAGMLNAECGMRNFAEVRTRFGRGRRFRYGMTKP